MNLQSKPSYGRRAAVIFSIALLVLLPHFAFAHAVLVKSSPAQGASVRAGALKIMLTYNSRIDAQHSSLKLVGSDGHPIALPVDTHAAQNVLQADAAALKPGAYKLEWQVQASDGHISRGIVAFRAR